MEKLKEILYVFLFCVPFAIVVYIAAHIGILIYKLYKMTKVNDIKVTDPEVVSDDFSAVIRRIDIENAKQVLRENGYFVDNLWQTCDVKNSYECTEQEAYNVLYEVFDTDNIQQEIAEMIWHVAKTMNLKQID